MASSRRPPLFLPPEIGAADDAWIEDERPTLARASRAPTAPVRIEVPSEMPTAPGIERSGLELDLRDDAQERVTTAPKMSPDEYARLLMARDPHQTTTEAPSPPSFEADASDFGLMLEAPDVPNSELPTAPPPTGFVDGPLYRMPPTSSVSRIPIDPGSMPTDIPPPAPPLSQPRVDMAAFSGRFSSMPPGDGDLEQTMKDRFAMGDFSGALQLADKLLIKNPRHVETAALATKCREVLEDMYASRISDMRKIPSIIMGPDQIRWLSLNHRSGFLLSMIDGVSSVDDLLDVSGMQRLDALRIVCSLLEQKVIALD